MSPDDPDDVDDGWPCCWFRKISGVVFFFGAAAEEGLVVTFVEGAEFVVVGTEDVTPVTGG